MEKPHQNKVLVIINGKAGDGYRLPRWVQWLLKIPVKEKISKEEQKKLIEDSFSKYNLDYKIVETTYAGHAEDLAKNAGEDGYDVVTAVGGDGTINEVVNALANTDTALAIIPAGTANLLASELEIPTNTAEACEIICNGIRRRIDTLQINDHIYTVTASVGFDAHVVKEVDEKNVKKVWGALSYVLIAFREFYRYPKKRIKIKTQTGKTMSVYALFVQNARTYATGYHLSPKSKMDDGVFEVLIIPTWNIFKLISYHTNKSKRGEYLEMYDVTSLEIISHQPIQIDGDYVCQGPAQIKINPKSLDVMVASDS